MKQNYLITLTVFIATTIAASLHPVFAQVPCPVGYPAGQTAYDTTIITPTGINTMQIKFPQFNPQAGMLTCVRLCISITGVVDSVSVENNSASPQTADVYYIRTDQLTGPGLSTPLTNSINHHYGPYALGPTDGTLGSGPDFVSISKDTVLNAVQVCQTMNDTAFISQFYGHDSVTYTYNITAFTNVSCTGGNYNSSVATSAFVRFRFEYCTCPGFVLPISIFQFSAKKVAGNKAELKWKAVENTPGSHHYEAEMSRNGMNFERIGVFPMRSGDINSSSYNYLYDLRSPGRYFFRIKQVNKDGRLYFTTVKFVDAEADETIKFIVYPNPSNGIVGIKFDNISAGKYVVLINNAQGQTVVNKEIEVSGNSYQQVTTLQPGFYWVTLTDVASRKSCVNQLLIK
jgi:hypothetical protein